MEESRIQRFLYTCYKCIGKCDPLPQFTFGFVHGGYAIPSGFRIRRTRRGKTSDVIKKGYFCKQQKKVYVEKVSITVLLEFLVLRCFKISCQTSYPHHYFILAGV